MALVTCPDCGKPVSSLAPSCIHCGRPIKNELIVKKPDILAEVAKGKRVSCQDGLCTGIIGKDGTCKTCGRPYKESDDEDLLEPDNNEEIQSSQIKCPFCGEEIQENETRCNHCKEFFSEEKCSDCGGLLKEGSHFCPKCGVIQINEENIKNVNDHRPIEEKVIEASINETNQNKKNKTAIWIGVAVVIFILLSIVGKKTDNPTNDSFTNTRLEEEKRREESSPKFSRNGDIEQVTIKTYSKNECFSELNGAIVEASSWGMKCVTMEERGDLKAVMCSSDQFVSLFTCDINHTLTMETVRTEDLGNLLK